MIRAIVTSFMSIALLPAPAISPAQSYPKQTINLIIPLAPGDTTDVAGRTIGEGLSKLLKVPVVAVNRPGAGGTIGTDRSEDHTGVLQSQSNVVCRLLLEKKKKKKKNN